MPYERIILDERLDASKEDIERLSSEFFSQYIYLAHKIEISFDFNFSLLSLPVVEALS